MSSWHYNYYDGKSVIQELIDVMTEGRTLLIYTDTDCWMVDNKNNIKVGEGAMMISSDDVVCFINTDKVTHIELHRSNKEINEHKKTLNDSEKD